jgi:hypothetical protein
MTLERKVRSVGTKSIAYPWLRRHVVVGPYNRHVRRDVAAGLLVTLFEAAADRARRRRAKVGTGRR